MTTSTTTFAALAAISVAVPASTNGRHPADRQLVGIGLMIAERGDDGWRFRRRAAALAAGEPEATLLQWAASELPAAGMLIGWGVDHALLPVLLRTAAGAAPDVATRFLSRLHPLLTGGAVDLAIEHGGAGAPSLEEVAAGMAIYAPSWNAEVLLGRWGIGDTLRLQRDVADEALAIWRVFVRSAGMGGLGAEAATDAWVRRLQDVRRRKRARRAGRMGTA